MNYILHLSAFYAKVYTDARLTPHHISLYSAIFQQWNAVHFDNPFQVNRHELMKLSKIGSINTYHRCLKELHSWNFIEYQPSKIISVGSRIRIITFDTTTDILNEPRVRHYIKPNKNILNIPTITQVESFFKKERFPEHQAKLFFNHYQATGWMMGKNEIKNWEAAAINWISNSEKFASKRKAYSIEPKSEKLNKVNSLSASTNKKYDEPL